MTLRLADKAYSDIVAMISNRSMQVGDRLPAESQLSEILGVSRTIVREALARLTSDGLTESRKGAGSFVIRLPSKLLGQHMHGAELPVVLGTYEVRFVLEAEAARLAALRRSREEMARIDGQLQALLDALRSSAPAETEDMELHREIMLASGNYAFVEAFDALSDGTRRVMRAGVDISRARSKDAVDAMIEEHSAIVEAIRLRDPDRAALTMRWHLSQGRRRLMP